MSGICSAHRHFEPGCPRCASAPPQYERDPAGWPRTLRELRSMPDGVLVRTRREFATGLVRIPEGSVGRAFSHHNGWHLLRFEGPPCPSCGVQAVATRIATHDLEPVRPREEGACARRS